MSFLGQENEDNIYVKENVIDKMLFNGSIITITNFFLCKSSIPSYDILAGIGKNENHRVLVGRALSHGRRGTVNPEINKFEYICIPISDKYSQVVKRDLENYRQEHNLVDAEIAIWPELLLEQK